MDQGTINTLWRKTASHWRQDPFFVTRKTLTKSSMFDKFVIKFEDAANHPTHNLSLCSSHNHNW